MDFRSVGRFGLAAWLLGAMIGSVSAATVRVKVSDQAGQPLADAVVYAEPIGGKPLTAPPAPAVIDQIKRRFVPMVSVVQTGASVTFPNKDNIEHDVYSFSPAKKFELNLYKGVPAKPVVFDKPGLVALGCNIHDAMIAFLVVVDTPFFGKSDASGAVSLSDLPAGNYKLVAWHARLAESNGPASQPLKLEADASTEFKLTVKAE